MAATAFSLTGFVLRMALQTACRPQHGWHSRPMCSHSAWLNLLEEVRKAKPLEKRGLEDHFNVHNDGKRVIIDLPSVKFTTHVLAIGDDLLYLFFWAYHISPQYIIPRHFLILGFPMRTRRMPSSASTSLHFSSFSKHAAWRWGGSAFRRSPPVIQYGLLDNGR